MTTHLDEPCLSVEISIDSSSSLKTANLSAMRSILNTVGTGNENKQSALKFKLSKGAGRDRCHGSFMFASDLDGLIFDCHLSRGGGSTEPQWMYFIFRLQTKKLGCHSGKQQKLPKQKHTIDFCFFFAISCSPAHLLT